MLFPAVLAHAADVRFVVVGDTQATSGDRINLDVWPAMAEDINAVAPDLVLFAGDLVNGSTNLSRQVQVWDEWDEVTQTLDAPRYAAAGNHDFFADGAQAAWGDTFEWLPRDNSPPGEEGLSYWFDVGDTRFIAVLSDAEGGAAAVPRLDWLEGALKGAATMAHTFVFTHHPVSFSDYEPVFGGTDGAWWQLLLAYDVDALLVGHWHVYQPGLLGGGPPSPERSGGGRTWELIAGTGGGAQLDLLDRPENLGYGFTLLEVDGPRVTVTFYRDEDEDGHYDDVADAWIMHDAAPPTPGLVAWYPFDDGGADAAPTGVGIPLTMFGAARDTAGDWNGNALSLDGQDDYAQAIAINSFEHALHGDLTVAAAGRAGARRTGDWSNVLVAYGSNDPYTQDETSNYAWWLSQRADGTLVAFWEHSDGENVTLTSTAAGPVDDAWHHYALVRDVAAMEARFYVDGAQLGAPVSFDRLPTGGQRGLLTLGTDPPPGDDSEWTGMLDEVCVLDRVLTAAEIATVATERSCASLAGASGGDTGTHTGGDTAQDTAPDSGADTQAETDSSGDSSDTSPGATDSPAETGAAKDPGCGCGAAAPSWAWLGALLSLGLRRR